MIGWRTRPRRHKKGVLEAASPSLVYHKWHAYDAPDPSLETTKSRVEFLGDVARRVNVLVRRETYRNWHDAYQRALCDLGAVKVGPFATLWRLVAGFATNPALETGIHLHPLYGFPCLPGSAVKGLVHHFAEMEILEDDRWEQALADGSLPRSPELLTPFLESCERVRFLFGSLTLDQGVVRVEGREEPIGPETPRTLLRRWLKEDQIVDAADEEPDALRERVKGLLGSPTGGRAAFYDAVPAGTASGDVLEIDVLNPHYPEYYKGTGGGHPPSDDQNPKPIFFLAVSPEVPFELFFRLRHPKKGEQGLIEKWLRRALTELGAGGKTAAGYGYFDVTMGAGKPRLESAVTPQRAEKGTEVWPQATLTWEPSPPILVAKWQKREARGTEQQLAALPEPVRNRLTGVSKSGGKKKRKSVVARVTVLVEGPSYRKILEIDADGPS